MKTNWHLSTWRFWCAVNILYIIQSIEISSWQLLTASILGMVVTLNCKHVGRVRKNVHAPLPVAQPPGSAAGRCWFVAAASAAGSTEQHLAAAVTPAEPADSKRKGKWLIWKTRGDKVDGKRDKRQTWEKETRERETERKRNGSSWEGEKWRQTRELKLEGASGEKEKSILAKSASWLSSQGSGERLRLWFGDRTGVTEQNVP